jgi:dephospho-CoA kinase
LHLFGLTGGIASGKSTAAARFRSRGVPVVDADELAREVVAPGTQGAAAIAATFGAHFLDANGALDRKALGRLVFSDPEARRRLNAITHPRIGELVRERARALDAAGEPLACYEAALIVENGTQDLFRPLVVVACPTELQVSRIRARDGISESEARARVLAQKPLAEKVAVADYVVDTAGSREATNARVDEVLRAICAAAGVEAARYFGSSTSP